MSEFAIMEAASAGMDAQRSALDLAARNVAAAEADGTHFERLVPRFSVAPSADADGAADANPAADPGEPPQQPDDSDAVDDAGSLPIRYLGSTAQRGSEVDAVTEMVAVLDAQRAYEANASVFDIGKRLAERTIDMGRLA